MMPPSMHALGIMIPSKGLITTVILGMASTNTPLPTGKSLALIPSYWPSVLWQNSRPLIGNKVALVQVIRKEELPMPHFAAQDSSTLS